MDKFELLKKYKELLEEGILDQEEFDNKKAELLEATEIKPALYVNEAFRQRHRLSLGAEHSEAKRWNVENFRYRRRVRGNGNAYAGIKKEIELWCLISFDFAYKTKNVTDFIRSRFVGRSDGT